MGGFDDLTAPYKALRRSASATGVIFVFFVAILPALIVLVSVRSGSELRVLVAGFRTSNQGPNLGALGLAQLEKMFPQLPPGVKGPDLGGGLVPAGERFDFRERLLLKVEQLDDHAILRIEGAEQTIDQFLRDDRAFGLYMIVGGARPLRGAGFFFR